MSPERPGVLGSARRLLTTGVELLQVRIELLSGELQLGALRLVDALLLALGAVAALVLGLGLWSALIVLIVQPEYRLLALGLMGLAWIAAAAALVAAARRRAGGPGGMLAATRAELAEDLRALRGDAAAGDRDGR